MIRIWAALLGAALAASVALNLRQAADFADFRDDTSGIIDRLAGYGVRQAAVIDALGRIRIDNRRRLGDLADRIARSEAGVRRGQHSLERFNLAAGRHDCTAGTAAPVSAPTLP